MRADLDKWQAHHDIMLLFLRRDVSLFSPDALSTGDRPMIEEIARHRCTGRGGMPRYVIEHRPVFTTHGEGDTSLYRGASRASLPDGEPVRYVDERTFAVIATGEMLVHDIHRCGCAPAPKITSIAAGSRNN